MRRRASANMAVPDRHEPEQHEEPEGGDAPKAAVSTYSTIVLENGRHVLRPVDRAAVGRPELLEPPRRERVVPALDQLPHARDRAREVPEGAEDRSVEVLDSGHVSSDREDRVQRRGGGRRGRRGLRATSGTRALPPARAGGSWEECVEQPRLARHAASCPRRRPAPPRRRQGSPRAWPSRPSAGAGGRRTAGRTSAADVNPVGDRERVDEHVAHRARQLMPVPLNR